MIITFFSLWNSVILSLFLAVNPPAPVDCPVGGRYRFIQRGDRSEFYTTRIRVTSSPSRRCWRVSVAGHHWAPASHDRLPAVRVGVEVVLREFQENSDWRGVLRHCGPHRASNWRIRSVNARDLVSTAIYRRYCRSRAELRRLLDGRHEVVSHHVRRGRRSIQVPLLGKHFFFDTKILLIFGMLEQIIIRSLLIN